MPRESPPVSVSLDANESTSHLSNTTAEAIGPAEAILSSEIRWAAGDSNPEPMG